MGCRLFVGGLSWNTTDDHLRQVFERFGRIEDVRVITDRDTGQSRGSAFVTFADAHAAKVAALQLNGALLDGRTIRVSEAEDQPRRGGGGGGFGGSVRGGRSGGGFDSFDGGGGRGGRSGDNRW